ncbi:MAG TPA: CARDB domain-containing protein [Planctomycetota bacterium]|nr:CARDB domain-containing protein [Planctomycetota bacterium]
MTNRVLILACACALLGTGCYDDDEGYDFRFEIGPTLEPDPPVANEAFELRFRARNSGDWDAEDVRWTVYRDGTEAQTGLIDLDEHESRDVIVLMNPDTAGTHTYRVVLDPRDRFDEEREGNNDASITVGVVPIIDPG